MSLPQAHADNATKSKEDAKCDTQTPDALHLEARGAVSTRPYEVIDLAHILADGLDECVGVAAGFGESGTVEIGQRLADGDGDDNNCDQESRIQSGGDQEWEKGIQVQNVGDGAV